MKIKLFLTLSAWIPSMAFAQFQFEKQNSDTAGAAQSAFSIDAHTTFSTVDSGTFRWVRIHKTLPDKITSAICDNNLCYGPDDDSADFFLGPNGSFAMTCYFYPNSGCGNAQIDLKVYKPSDPAAGEAYTVFHGHIWCTTASVHSFKKGEMQIVPNPADDHLFIHYGSSSAKTLRIADIHGNVLIEREFHGLSEKIDLGQWSKGIYFAIVTDGQASAVKSFIKY